MRRTGTSSLLVAAYLPMPLLVRMVDAARAVGAELRSATSWDELSCMVRETPVNLMIVDPYIGHSLNVLSVNRLLKTHRSTPMVAYTEFSPATARILTSLSRKGLGEAVLFRYDDTPIRLQRLITRSGVVRAVADLRARLQVEYDRLPVDVASALDDLFHRPHAYSTAGDLRLQSGRPKASLHRIIASAGLAPPRHLFIGARVLHAYLYLRDNDVTVADVAKKVGYRNTFVMTQHIASAFNLKPNALRQLRDENEVLDRLVTWLRMPAEEEAGIADGSPDGDDTSDE